MSDPKWLKLARAELGTTEAPGSKNNPQVMDYYADASGSHQPDDVPWCAAFVGAMLKRAGVKPSGSLMARSYLNWGSPLKKPVPGAITVFSRSGAPYSGHVAFFLQESGSKVQVLGGNQSDAVTVAWYPKSRLLGYRWPKGAFALRRTHALRRIKRRKKHG